MKMCCYDLSYNNIQFFILQNMKTALVIFILTLTSSALARPPSFDSEEYIDNNLVDSIPEGNEEDERTEYVQM